MTRTQNIRVILYRISVCTFGFFCKPFVHNRIVCGKIEIKCLYYLTIHI